MGRDDEGHDVPIIDVALGALLFGLGVAIIVLSFDITAGVVRDPIGVKGVPIGVGGILAFLSLMLIGRSLFVRRPTASQVLDDATEASATADADSPALAAETDTRRAWLAALLSAAYLALLIVVGYIAASMVIAAALVLLLEPHRRLVAVTWAIGLTIFLFLTFTRGLGIRLP